MLSDPIVEEVRRVRQEYARRLNYDLHAIAADLRKREQEHPKRLASFPAEVLHRKKGRAS